MCTSFHSNTTRVFHVREQIFCRSVPLVNKWFMSSSVCLFVKTVHVFAFVHIYCGCFFFLLGCFCDIMSFGLENRDLANYLFYKDYKVVY